MGGTSEVIDRRDAKPLSHIVKCLQRLTLSREARDQFALQRSLGLGKFIDYLWHVSILFQDPPHLKPAAPRMIKIRFDHERSSPSSSPVQRHGVVYGKCACVMVWMSALVGVSENDLRIVISDLMRNPLRHFNQIQARLLIGKPETAPTDALKPRFCEHSGEFACSRLAIIIKGLKAVCLAVMFIARSAVRYVNKMSCAESRHPRPQRDCLVIGMRHNHHGPRHLKIRICRRGPSPQQIFGRNGRLRGAHKLL